MPPEKNFPIDNGRHALAVQDFVDLLDSRRETSPACISVTDRRCEIVWLFQARSAHWRSGPGATSSFWLFRRARSQPGVCSFSLVDGVRAYAADAAVEGQFVAPLVFGCRLPSPPARSRATSRKNVSFAQAGP